MANISQITVNDTPYEIFDVTAQELYSSMISSQWVDWYVRQIDSNDTNTNVSLSAATQTYYPYWKIVHKRIFSFSDIPPSPFLYLINPIGEATSHPNNSSIHILAVGHFSYYDSSTLGPDSPANWIDKREFPSTIYPILHTSYTIKADPSSYSTWTSELGLLSGIARTKAHMKLNSWILTKDNVEVGNVDTGNNGVLHTRQIDIWP